MNDLLQQLIGLAPGLGQAATGNGPQFAAFMQGFERARQADEQRKRLQQQDSLAMQDRDLAMQDRERNIQRQTTADARATEDQNWQNEQRKLAVAGTLNQAANGAETQQQGEASIDALYRMLSPELQTTMAPARDAAMMGVSRTVTGRQKKQVEAYVEQAMKTAYVADNPDADPEMQLPEHLQKILGKPSARLSELQQFAQLPIGKPASKPSDEVSWQIREGIGPDGTRGMFRINPKTGETQPVRGITPEPPRPPDSGAQDNRINSRIDRITNSFNASPLVKEFNEVQAQYQTISQVVNSAWSGPGDMSIIFAFMKALDPTSVVREAEYANAAKSGNIFTGWAAKFNGALSPNGGFLSEQVKRDFLKTIETRMGVKRAQYDNLRKQTVQKIDRIKAGAPETGDEAVTDYGAAFPQQDAPSFKVGQKVRSKKTGEVREVTGVRPDGSPILGPVKQ